MKKSIFIGLAAGGMMLVAAIACKKSFNNQGFDVRGTSAGPFIDTMTLPQVISSDMTLAATTLWLLNGKSYVASGVTLTVSAGARIEAKKFSNNDSASALIVTRGGKLFAEGSQTTPIVFTSNEASPASGDWGGIVLLGDAPLNRADTTIEGIQLPTVPVGIDVNYGGGGQGLGDTTDCSGRLSYVRIEYAGAVISPDNELNALTCGGVGAGTVLDHIEAYYGNDDAFEFFGGNVNAKFLFAYVPDDDAFDFDFGYSGKIQFAVSVLNTTESYSANPNGIESDNNGTGANLTPYTKAVLSNLTVIGLNNSADATSKLLFNGAYYRRRSSYILRNSIVMGFPVGVRLDSDIPTQADEANITKNIVHAFSIPDTMAGPSSSWNLNATNKRLITSVANDSIKLHAPFASTPDFRPDATSPALSWGTDFTGLPTTPVVGCAIASWTFTSTSYVGAFPAFSGNPNTNWLNGWARY